MNRNDKIKVLESVFNYGNYGSVANACKEPSILLLCDHDNGITRQEKSLNGNCITLYNYTDEQLKKERERLLNHYEMVLLIKLYKPNYYGQD